jgi:hypothetical protein
MRTTHVVSEIEMDLPTPYECVPPPSVKCFSEYLRRAGYYCSNNRKTDYQFQPPSTAWDDCSQTGHWRNRSDGQPFFAVWNFDHSHESCMWEPDTPGAFIPTEATTDTDPNTVSIPPEIPDTPATRLALARHYDRLVENDRRLGALLDQLEEDGLADQTLVMVWSDHGSGLPRHKRWPYDGGILVPLIVRWPGIIPAKSRDDRLVSQVNFAPTMLSAAGIEPPAHMHGITFCGPKETQREYIFATRDRYDSTYDKVRAVRDQRFKLIRNDCPEMPRLGWLPFRNKHAATQALWVGAADGTLTPAQRWATECPRPVWELYDTKNDPHELTNVAYHSDHTATLERLQHALHNWEMRFDRYGNIPEAEMVHSWWGGSEQPGVSEVFAIALGPHEPGIIPLGSDDQPAAGSRIQLQCPTQGSSIEYAWDGGPSKPDAVPRQMPAGPCVPHWLPSRADESMAPTGMMIQALGFEASLGW